MNGGGWFDWDESNEDHVLAHGVEPAEVEEALLDPEGLGPTLTTFLGNGARLW